MLSENKVRSVVDDLLHTDFARKNREVVDLSKFAIAASKFLTNTEAIIAIRIYCKRSTSEELDKLLHWDFDSYYDEEDLEDGSGLIEQETIEFLRANEARLTS